MLKQIDRIPCGVVLAALLALQTSSAAGQTLYGSPSSTTSLTGTPTLTPIPPTTPMGPTSTLQQPTFDPYSSQPGTLYSPPSLLSPASPYGSAPPPSGYTQTLSPQDPGTQPYYNQPYTGFGASAPPVMYPQGTYGTPQTGASPIYDTSLKLFQNMRLSYAWLYGDKGMDLDINDAYLTSTLAFPNFLWSGQPWFVSPGFGLHLWSGPQDIYGWYENPPGLPNRTEYVYPMLPSKAYSAFLDLGWMSDPNAAFGVELSGRLGIYSDFGKVDNASFRPKGVALLRLKLSPTVAIKGGVEYINRADIKLLPAFGVTWTPNPQTRFDIYFPQPKVSSYLTTLGNNEMWWYLGGEYGGGSWTTEAAYRAIHFGPGPVRLYEGSERTLMDINDLRVFLGLEFERAGTNRSGRKTFIEVGYVWERQLFFTSVPAIVAPSFPPDRIYPLSDTFMLRGGIAF